MVVEVKLTPGGQRPEAYRRVDTLRAAGLLGAPAEERFDRLTRLAQRLLRVPVALITLLDVERQFFLSVQGLAEPWASLRETPLSHSFCRLVVERGAPLSVADARKDPQLRDHPAIEALGVVAYLAVPLPLPGGGVVGALCAIDTAPRDWSREDEQALADLASAVVAEMSARQRLQELEAATDALRLSEARYRALIEVSPQMVWITDAQGRNTYVNRECADFFGWPLERLLGDGWTTALHPDDRERVLAAWAEAVESGRDYEVEFRLRRGADGSYRWILVRGRPLRDQDGGIEGWIGIGMNIDDRRRTETMLRELIEALGVAVYTTDAAGRLTYYNEAAVHLWGWRPPLGDARWCGFWRLYWPDGRPMRHEDCPMSQALRENRPIRSAEAVAERPDGSRVPFAPYPMPLRNEAGQVVGGVNVLVDLTERKAAEQALAESEARLRLALEAGHHAFWELDIATGKVVRAPFHDEIFGYPVTLPEWSYRAFLGHVLPEDRAQVETAYRAAIEDGSDPHLEFRIRRAGDGRICWIELHGRVHQDAEGQAVRLHGVLRDITDRKRTEAALREKEARMRSILETVPDAMVVFDEQGRIESCSATAETLFGYAAGQIVSQDITALIPDLPLELRGTHPASTVPGWARERGATSPPPTGRRKDGSTFPVELAIGEVRLEARRLFTGFVRDLTERQATEARLQDLQAELLHITRVSAAGEMASALAHELNQPLTAVAITIGAAQAMLEMVAPDATDMAAGIHEAMDFAAEQALRAGQIVRRLGNFVARGEADKRLEDLGRLIEETSSLTLVGARERGVQVAFRLDPGLPSVIVDRIQIQQVLHNLMRNAIEALTAEGSNAGRRELVLSASLAGRDAVQVSISDTGPGIAPEVADRLFETFVSSKPGGMGVGLSISRSIIEAHGGRLWVEPNPEGGAVFRFTLPAAPPSESLAF